MKPANKAPFYAALYPGLCDIARKHGYALAIHGTMLTDLDLLACPWTEETPEPEAMVAEMKEHLGALFYTELLERTVHDERNIEGILKLQNYEGEPKAKPHGRRAWSLHLDCGAYIDLSVMPRRVA
jgi:hypothetical protein